MELILIVIAGTLIAMCFLLAFAAGFYVGSKYSENKIENEAIKITEKNKRAVRKYKNFADYNG